jgi:glycerol-3-phosphate dehydrogenase
VEGIVTVVGGKLATYRLMAEKTADLVCRRLGIEAPCRTPEIQIG